MLIVSTDPTSVEAELIAGLLDCPNCQASLRPWGFGIERVVRLLSDSGLRRFRRSICSSCRSTHVLIPKDTLVRRRDGVEVIGAALVARAQGIDQLQIADELHRPRTTVQGWLDRFSANVVAIREHFIRWAYALDPTHPLLRSPAGSAFNDAVDAIGMLGIVTVRRFGPGNAWLLASVATGGRLLYNTSTSWPMPV